MACKGRTIFMYTILTRIDGKKLRLMICLLLHEIGMLQWFIQGRYSSSGGMMVSTESMTSLSTTLITILGKKF